MLEKRKEESMKLSGIGKIGKKGFIQDILMMMLFLFVFAITTYIALTVWNDYKDKTTDVMDTTYTEEIIVHGTSSLMVMDYAFLMLFGGLLLSTIVTAFFIRSHPVLFVLSLIMLFVVLVMSVVYSNVFEKFEAQGAMQNATDTYTIIPEIMSKYPLYIFGTFILVALAFFAKARMEVGGP